MLRVVEHRLEGIAYTESPNFDSRPPDAEISLVVIHGISLPAGDFGTGLVHQLFLNTLKPERHAGLDSLIGVRVSAHVLIERNGTATQFVTFDRRAWHAGESSFRGVRNCNNFAIGIELEGTDVVPYVDAQYRTLRAVLEGILDAYSGVSLSRILGHQEISPGRKTDPGPHFDWKRLYRELSAGGFGGSRTG